MGRECSRLGAMTMLRVSWGLSAFVWMAFIVLACLNFGWPATATAVIWFVLPDLGFLGGFVERGRLRAERVALYNIMHTVLYPIILLAIGIAVFAFTGWIDGGFWPLALAGAAWFVHIAVGRAVGHGFRDKEGLPVPVA